MTISVVCWKDADWYLGTAKGIPGVFTQGKSLEDVLENLHDAIRLMLAEGDEFGPGDVGVPSRPSGLPSLETTVRLDLPENEEDD